MSPVVLFNKASERAKVIKIMPKNTGFIQYMFEKIGENISGNWLKISIGDLPPYSVLYANTQNFVAYCRTNENLAGKTLRILICNK